MKGIVILAFMTLSACEYTQPIPYPYVSYIPEMGHRSAVYMVPTSVLAFPSDPTLYYNRGWHFYQRRDYDRAISEYDEAIRLDPSNPGYYFARGVAYVDVNDYRKAVNDFRNGRARIYSSPKTALATPSNARALPGRTAHG